FYQKALAIRRRTLGEDHPATAESYKSLAAVHSARGRYADAEAMAIAAVKGFEDSRLRVSFTGLDRAMFVVERSPLPLLAMIQARLGRPQHAWQRWEANLARGLFDDLAARRVRVVTPGERRSQEDLFGQLSRLDNQIAALAGSKDIPADRRQRLQDLKNQRL